MHNQPETLGSILKAAREKSGITIEALAERAEITERYLYRIENEGIELKTKAKSQVSMFSIN